MTAQSSTEWNPKWLAFLDEKGLTTSEADEMGRQLRRSLNAEFMCWNMRGSDFLKRA